MPLNCFVVSSVFHYANNVESQYIEVWHFLIGVRCSHPKRRGRTAFETLGGIQNLAMLGGLMAKDTPTSAAVGDESNRHTRVNCEFLVKVQMQVDTH